VGARGGDLVEIFWEGAGDGDVKTDRAGGSEANRGYPFTENEPTEREREYETEYSSYIQSLLEREEVWNPGPVHAIQTSSGTRYVCLRLPVTLRNAISFVRTVYLSLRAVDY
jgi:hypothetical protein